MRVDRQRSWIALTDGTEFSVIDGTYTLDDTRAPYGQGSAIIRTPGSLARLDPRIGQEIILTMTTTFATNALAADVSERLAGAATVADLSTIFASATSVAGMSAAFPSENWNAATIQTERREARLWLRGRNVRHDATTELTFATAEILLIDQVARVDGIKSNPTLRGLLNAIFADIAFQSRVPLMPARGGSNYNLPTDTDPNYPGQTITNISAGQSYYDVLVPYLQSGDMRLWADENGTFYLEEEATTTPGTAFIGGYITDYTDAIDLDEDLWSDGVLIRYLRGSKLTATGYNAASYVPPEGALKWRIIDVDAWSPINQFMNEEQISRPALRIYNRMRRRGRRVDAASVSNYNVTPRQQAYVTIPSAPLQYGTVQAVTWSLAAALMSVTTRDLVNA